MKKKSKVFIFMWHKSFSIFRHFKTEEKERAEDSFTLLLLKSLLLQYKLAGFFVVSCI